MRPWPWTTERQPRRRARRRTAVPARAALLAAVLVIPLAAPATASAAEGREGRPSISLSDDETGAGGEITVQGKGWRKNSLLTLLVCGQNAIGGTNSCANADGRTARVGSDGTFRRKLPVTEPPKACPCVVRATAVTGAYAADDAEFTVAGHPVKRLPRDNGGGRLSVLDARLVGEGGILTWFGAPPQRTLRLTVANQGADRATDPVFRVGAAHGVYAPSWETQQWRGHIDPGRTKRVELPVELSAGAHGDYTVSARYGGTPLTEQPWEVGRPWGVTLFWVLLCLVVPAAVFRAGMALVERLRPRRPGRVVHPDHAGRRRKGARTPLGALRPRPREAAPRPEPPQDGALPWFTPDRDPVHTTISAPPDDRPSKGSNP